MGRPGTSLKMGLLGMANIGKSSTFNILSNLNVPAENMPFCTIDPNSASIPVKDQRFDDLVKLYKPAKSAGPIFRIVDIAGLVKGASEGFGLGNEFLSHVMQVDGLYHVVRAFAAKDVAHTEGSMDPVRDIKIIRHELIQKDIEIIEKKVKEFAKKASKTQDKNIKEEYEVLAKVENTLKKDQLEIRNIQWVAKEIEVLNKYLLLTSKPMVYLLNLSKEDYLSGKVPNKTEIEEVITMNGKYLTNMIPFSIEYEKTVQDKPKEKSEVQNIIRAGYDELEIAHFYTVGTDEVRAWAIRKGETAPEAGGKIHSDFTRGFINAEVIHADVLLKNPTYKDKLGKYSKK